MANKKSGLLSSAAGANDPLEKALRVYIDEFVANNKAAQVVADGLRVIGIGLRPLIDHITFRTLDVEVRAKEFQQLGYIFDSKSGVIEDGDWWAKVYRKPGYPAIFIDQAFNGERGKNSIIPAWVQAFGDKVHHMAIQVDDIETAIFYLEKQGIPFTGRIMGDRGTDLRQIFAQPEMRKGKIFTVFEVIERHRGSTGFLPPESSGLAATGKR
jgi:hypothetical protein